MRLGISLVSHQYHPLHPHPLIHPSGANQAGAINTSLHSTPSFSDTRHDALLALMAWTESDITPTEIIATKWLNDTPALGVVRQRPLCPFPSVAQYQGSGDVNEAENWGCAELPFKLPVAGNETAVAGSASPTVTVSVSVTATVTQVQMQTQIVTATWSWPWQWQSQGGRPTGSW